MADKTSVMRGPKEVKAKSRSVLRTMTAGTALCTVPRGARLLGVILTGVASDATVSATVQFGTSATSTELSAAESVLAAGKGNGGFIGFDATASTPLAAETKIYAIYAESGTASANGAWVATILYTEGNDIADDNV